MEQLADLLTGGADIRVRLLALVLAAQAVFSIRMYSQMSKARVSAAKAGTIEPDMYKATANEPEELRVYTRAVANQFEMPVLFFAIVVAGLAMSSTTWITLVLAALYVGARILHGNEMISTNTVFKRRRLFIRSAQIMLLLIVEFVISALLFAQA